ncbi:MAG: carboxymuconolactone decarboxylase family protein [Pseudomonadota bacterium]
MPHLPYIPADVVEPKALVDAIRLRRGGELLNLDRMLLHSAPFAAGWNTFLGAVRTDLALSPKLRELAMCVVATLNDAEYEFTQHAPLFIREGGTLAQANALRQPDLHVQDQALFDAAERAAIQLTIEMTRSVKVRDDTFIAVREALPGHRQVVELVGVIAAYNMVSRFLVAMGVEPE